MSDIDFHQFPTAHRDELRKLSDHIHDHPELGGQEFEAVKTVSAFLTSHGLPFQPNYCNLETAWRSEVGSGSPVFVPAFCPWLHFLLSLSVPECHDAH